MTKKALSVAVLVLLGGCASPTPYMHYGDLRYGGLIHEGYQDERIGEREHAIVFHANPYTSRELISSYWHRRAEELCGSEHYTAEMEVQERYSKENRRMDIRYPVATGKVKCL